MNILIVDDEKAIVQGIVKHISKLTDLHATAVGAYSAEEALNLMEQFRPHLLITDIRMPGKDGLELIQEASTRNLCTHCMILSAYEEFEYAKRALDYRVIGYLVKPIDWAELDARLRELSHNAAQRQRSDEVLQRYAHLYAHAARTDLSPTLKKITRYVQRNYAQDLSLVRLSCQTGFTESYLCTLFKKELGITFLDYVNELRLRQAMASLIESPQATVKEISSLVGYHSERQLFRLFSAHLGMTPQQFRDQIDTKDPALPL